MSFLDLQVSREKEKFVATVSKKSTFSGMYAHSESFLSTVCKFGMVYTFAYCCFKFFSDWTSFMKNLVSETSFFENGYVCSLLKTTLKHLLASRS